MKKTQLRDLTQEECLHIDGGNWFSDFTQGFKEGFNWAAGVLNDIVNLLTKK